MAPLTDEQAKELVPKTICGIEVMLPRVYVEWVKALLSYYETMDRSRLAGICKRVNDICTCYEQRKPLCKQYAEVLAERRLLRDHLRDQMRRLDGMM
jgi:hypothetical protein